MGGEHFPNPPRAWCRSRPVDGGGVEDIGHPGSGIAPFEAAPTQERKVSGLAGFEDRIHGPHGLDPRAQLADESGQLTA